ncbi:MAG: hypothetical protein CSA62_11010 [Planctomycetota bacterium]|nr:MAG: hypothetical protein CSA62_11010 [Planctomycetota bacterium]
MTLLELMVVLGLLVMLLGGLVTILDRSLFIWQVGEEGADLEARAYSALDSISGDLDRMAPLQSKSWRLGRVAVLQGREGQVSATGRFVLDHLPYLEDGKPVAIEDTEGKAQLFDWYPRLRFVMQLDPIEAERRLRGQLRRQILEDEGDLGRSELERRVREKLVDHSPETLGEILLRVRPQLEGEGVYLDLYRDWRSLGEVKAGRWVDGARMPDPGEPWLRHLLYVGLRLRSQFTSDFDAAPGDEAAAESAWDSARAGLLGSDHPVLGFSLDLDAQSEEDPLDDVMPKAYELTVVVDGGPGRSQLAFLSSAIDAKEKHIQVDYPERLPNGERNHIKIGPEWIRYSGIDGNRLLGVHRGVRNTKARPHAAAARIHSGREAVLRVPIAVSRSNWNG